MSFLDLKKYEINLILYEFQKFMKNHIIIYSIKKAIINRN